MPHEDTPETSTHPYTDVKKPKGGLNMVTIVGTLPPLKAISSYCEGMALGLAQHTHVQFFSFKALYPKLLYPGKSQLDNSRQKPNAPNLKIDSSLAWYNPFSWLAAGFRIRGEIVNLQWWSLPLAPILITIALIAKLRGIPVITTIHNVVPHGTETYGFRQASRSIYALSNLLIVHSEQNALTLKKRYPTTHNKIVVSPMGAVEIKHKRNIDQTNSRTILNISKDRKVLLLLGALRDYKGWDTTLKAVHLVVKKIPQVLLVIAGQAWDSKSRYHESIELHKLNQHVRLDLDYISEDKMHDYLSATDIVLLPYKYFESQSGIGVSSLQYGKPLIVSECGSLPDLVTDPLCLFSPGDANMLADRIIKIMDSERLYKKLSNDSLALAQHTHWGQIMAKLCNRINEHIRMK